MVYLDGWRREAVAVGILTSAFFTNATRARAMESDPPNAGDVATSPIDQAEDSNPLLTLRDSGHPTHQECAAAYVLYSNLPASYQPTFLNLAARSAKSGVLSVVISYSQN